MEDTRTWTEAPASATIRLISPDGYDVMFTLRGDSGKDLLPTLKFARSSAFRVATLGGQYQWGGVRIAEEHFATEASEGRFKAMVVKINAHVALETDGHGLRFGSLPRYRRHSTYCGALHALLGGKRNLPALEELQETFASEGVDRVAVLNDAGRVPPVEVTPVRFTTKVSLGSTTVSSSVATDSCADGWLAGMVTVKPLPPLKSVPAVPGGVPPSTTS